MKSRIGWGLFLVVAVSVTVFLMRSNDVSADGPQKSASHKNERGEAGDITSASPLSATSDVPPKPPAATPATVSMPVQPSRKINISYYEKAMQGLGLSSAEIDTLR